MNLFRTLLWWLLLAAFGALAWELLSPDLGEVVLRWHGTTISTTVAFSLLSWALLWFGLWVLWTVLRLPFTGWQRLAQKQARNRLINGLLALHEGRHGRAEALLEKAAEETDARAVARLAAREAALRRGDLVAAAMQQTALAEHDPLSAALVTAQGLLEQQRAAPALDCLQPWHDKRLLPPRGLLLRAQALADSGRAVEALDTMAALTATQSYSAERLAELERDWQALALTQAGHANELQLRWSRLPERWRDDAAVLGAYARRADELGLESEAAQALTEALDQRWNEAVVRQLALLPAGRDDQRLARAEAWLPEHPTSPALALCLGRLCRHARRLGSAEEVLHRAIALGAGAEAWEELAQVYVERDDATNAQACYANALRCLRGEPPRPLSDRSLREQIADEAVAEQRNEHGLPSLRP